MVADLESSLPTGYIAILSSHTPEMIIPLLNVLKIKAWYQLRPIKFKTILGVFAYIFSKLEFFITNKS